MRDAATNLAFYLPEGWVADVTPAAPFPRVEFAENTGSTHSIWLNPADWPLGERGAKSPALAGYARTRTGETKACQRFPYPAIHADHRKGSAPLWRRTL
ncbi:hypothetical protein V6L77_22465 [Pannonibacter sp. Pt2-lr]